MTWFKTDDGFWRHRKVRRLGRAKVTVPAQVACAGLWQLAGNWAADTGSDGFVPDEQVEQWDPRHRIAARLVEVKLWHRAEVDGEHGYVFHDWHDYQPSAAEEAEKRAKKVAAGRVGGRRSGQVRRSKNEAGPSRPNGNEMDTTGAKSGSDSPVGPAVTPAVVTSFPPPPGGSNGSDLHNHEATTEAPASRLVEAKSNPVPTRIGATHPEQTRSDPNAHDTSASESERETIPAGPGATGPNARNAWTAVQATTPAGTPNAVRGQLARAAAQLLDEGHPGTQVTAALLRLHTTPGAGPGLLPNLLNDLQREQQPNAYGVRSSGSGARSARSDKVQGWAELGAQVQAELDAGRPFGLIEGGRSA